MAVSKRKLLPGFFALLLAAGLPVSCGVNTDQPVYPIFSFLGVASPAIVDVQAVQYIEGDFTDPEAMRIIVEFDLSYYVTNQESDFLGYNLYMSSTTTSSDSEPGGIFAGEPYLPDGYEPTFVHADDEASTASEDLFTSRVEYFSPPPKTERFKLCEIYYFRLRAYTRQGILSNPSAQFSLCAAEDPSICPADSPCQTLN